MSSKDLFSFACAALKGHPIRVGLCVTGIGIGIMAIVVLTALGEGARRYVVNQFMSIGNNLLIIIPGKTETTGAFPGFVGAPHDLTIADSQIIRRNVRAIQYLAPISMGTETVHYGERRRQVPIVGTTSDFLDVRNLEIALGHFLPAGDPQRGSPVVVLGHRVAQELFPSVSPLGQLIRVADWRMRVIGVLAPRGTQLGMDMDDLVIVPVATGMQLLNRHSLFRILLRVRSLSDMKTTCDRIRTLMTQRHGEDDITCITQDAVVSTFSSILNALTLALAAIGIISLTVAGIGVMNVMLVAVSDRTEEIGLLKALGARNGQILLVFLTEAVVLSLAGGIIGLAVGWSLVQGLVTLYPAIPASTPAWASISAVAMSIFVGIVFGLIPARRAGQLDPIQALEHRVT
ncbi:MAG: ABC transporter permease [Nitrospirales bacterium]|nr:ABC transporter permease [Nitrospira sp.]MDR4501062.1 ABC transporter permease [Nitrospirales bacterium]